MEKSPANRIFIGISLDPFVRVELFERLRTLSPALDFTEGTLHKWHFTLAFLGSLTPQEFQKLTDIFVKWDTPRFLGKFGQLGAFPKPSSTRILWVGLSEGIFEFQTLYQEIHDRLEDNGFHLEERPFVPHLTLRRFKRMEDLRKIIADTPSLNIPFEVGKVTLFNSYGDGRNYEILREEAL
jgi:2'-5' RNA ligase